MKKILFAVAMVSMFTLTACEPERKVTFDMVESQRTQATDNATFNARKYFAENPRFGDDFKIVSHTDSTISEKCVNGDGWATLTIMKVEGKNIEKYKVKCSTTSLNLGCYLEADFAKKGNIAQEDGVCQPESKVPYPLPKFAK